MTLKQLLYQIKLKSPDLLKRENYNHLKRYVQGVMPEAKETSIKKYARSIREHMSPIDFKIQEASGLFSPDQLAKLK